ncbi:MCE family protein [Saccharomonospora halophila]|uniref:MCE family protein n=1 Tax=Saccharomonospora halophila TaxID=129922 RepID=UPI00037C2B5B|nr:MCE family protein [Saccharomonospora halophila]
MKPLRERNQATVGAVSLVLIVLVVVAAYRSDEIPMLNTSSTYSAHFAESAGLEAEAEVQIAGVKVGEVDEVELDGTRVRATFTVDSFDATRIGDRTTAAIKIKTLLGDKFLELAPEGESPQDPASVIPVERTRTPFELQDAFDRLSGTVEEIDTGQLADSFDVVADVLSDTSAPMSEALSGLSALSETVASRDAELARLLSNTDALTGTLASRNEKLRAIVHNGNRLLDEIAGREQAIDSLLRGTRRVSRELTGMVADTEQDLRPALERLDSVTDMLQRNRGNLQRSLELLGPFTRIGTNVTGNGRWFEGYICGMLPPTINVDGAAFNPGGCDPGMAAPNQGVESGGR